MALKAGLEGRRASWTTIHDIAAHTAVSLPTVSRVVNGRPDVSPKTREVVLQCIREQGYSTNRSARGLAGGRGKLVSLSMPYIDSAYFGEIAAGAAEALRERDAHLFLCLAESADDRAAQLLDRLMQGATDGSLIVLPSESNGELLELREQGFPFVVIDPMVVLDESLPVVMSAHWQAARAATEHLIGLGHRRIAAITGLPHWVASIDRLAGFRTVMSSAGILPDPDLICAGDWEPESGYSAACSLLDLPEPPTAIFSFNDNMAVGVVQAARERGLDVPRDLSVVGVDDIEVTRYLTPPLTTVRQSLREMARVASVMLWRLVEGEAIESMRLELATRLVIRESTAPPRSAAISD